MTAGHRHCESPDQLQARMDACGVSKRLSEYITRCVAFHTSPAPGVLVGAFMMDYALELLGAMPGEKLFAVCETPKCLPDAPQVIANCTTGNNRLKVLPIGKFALTLNRASDGHATEGVRVYVDEEKLRKFSVIDMWYANSSAYDKHTMDLLLQEEIFRNGREFLSFEKVRVPVRSKQKWKPVTCPCCGESIPDYMMIDGKCGACGTMKYFEPVKE